jgi:hypothetical protein
MIVGALLGTCVIAPALAGAAPVSSSGTHPATVRPGMSIACPAKTQMQKTMKMTIVNTTGLANTKVYVGLTGTTGSIYPCTLREKSIPLTTLPKTATTTNGYTFTIGQVPMAAPTTTKFRGIQSGNLWMSLTTAIPSLTSSQPTANTTAFPYEQVELTYPGAFDFTQVNQFSFPVSMDVTTKAGTATHQDFGVDACPVVNGVKKAALTQGATWGHIVKAKATGGFLRMISPSQNTHATNPTFTQGWASLEPYVDSLASAGKTFTLKGLYLGKWYKLTGSFSAGLTAMPVSVRTKFEAWGSDTLDTLKLSGTVGIPTTTGPTKTTAGVASQTMFIPVGTGTTKSGGTPTAPNDLATGAYDGNSFRVIAYPPAATPAASTTTGTHTTEIFGGLLTGTAQAGAPNDVYNTIYNNLVAGLSYGYWGGNYGTSNTGFWTTWHPPQSPEGGQPAFATARPKTTAVKGDTWNSWSQALFEFSSAYNSPYSDNYGSGAPDRPSPDLPVTTPTDHVVMTLKADGFTAGTTVWKTGTATTVKLATCTTTTGAATGPGPGHGYYQVAADGGVFAFGDAQFHGSMGGQPLNDPIVGIAATPDGGGYWLVAADGGVFAFGDAQFYGSMGEKPSGTPIEDLVPAADGYWEVSAGGAIYPFGHARALGSMAGAPLAAPVVGMAPTFDDQGYWLVAADGGNFAFGDATFFGSMGGQHLDTPIVGMAVVR